MRAKSLNVGFYIEEMNVRGAQNSTYLYAIYNKSLLKNKSIIFYNPKANFNNKEVIKKFKKKFKTIPLKKEKKLIDASLEKNKINYLYIQAGGEKNNWLPNSSKIVIHQIFPHFLSNLHINVKACVSPWLSKKVNNKKIPCLPLIVELVKTKKNLKKKLKIKKNNLVFGCHGGDSSFDLPFVRNTIIDTVKNNKKISFIFLGIKKFYSHPQIIFLKATSNDFFKKKFLNTCDAMIYGRSLGESFGLSIAEFSLSNKPIFLYSFSRHRSQYEFLSTKRFKEYNSKSSLINLLNNFKNLDFKLKNSKNYINYKPLYVMKKFSNIFLKNNKLITFNIFDYIMNFIFMSIIGYYYIRHKLYYHYHKFFDSKI